MGSPHHARTAVAVLALGLAGCADVDFTLNEDGSGTFNVRFNAPNAQPDVRQLVSPHVKVRTIARSGVSVSVDGTFDDVTKLPTAQAMRGFTIVRRQLRQDERIRVVFLNRRIERIPPSQRGVWTLTLAVNLPGRVRFANRAGERAGNRVVWRLPFTDFREKRVVKLSMRYARPGEPPPARTESPKERRSPVLPGGGGRRGATRDGAPDEEVCNPPAAPRRLEQPRL